MWLGCCGNCVAWGIPEQASLVLPGLSAGYGKGEWLSAMSHVWPVRMVLPEQDPEQLGCWALLPHLNLVGFSIVLLDNLVVVVDVLSQLQQHHGVSAGVLLMVCSGMWQAC
jgi:hypothetical protein